MQRTHFLVNIEQGFRTSSVVALLGPRQCGKTTLAQQFFEANGGKKDCYFDLEHPIDLTRLSDPLLALEELSGLIVIDEIQRLPNLFQTLRVLVDRKTPTQRYLVLGSASRELIRQSSESLAGRIHYLELTPFSFEETGNISKLWLRGGFPRSFLAETDEDSAQWRLDYIKTFLEQDIPALGISLPAEQMRRFWLMLSHYHGQIFNASEIGNSLDLSHHTVQRYLDILTGTFMVRQLAPWHENIAKRQVKSKKIYFRDTGILHTLLNISQAMQLNIHPKLGASWEGFALESLMRHLSVHPADCYFWSTHSGAELDLLVVSGLEKQGFEFKYTKTPKLTRSMKIAMDDLNLNQLTVIYPGNISIRLAKNIKCVGLESILER